MVAPLTLFMRMMRIFEADDVEAMEREYTAHEFGGRGPEWALSFAILLDAPQIVEYFLLAGTNPNGDYGQRTLANIKSVKVLQLLFDYGLDPLLCTEDGFSALKSIVGGTYYSFYDKREEQGKVIAMIAPYYSRLHLTESLHYAFYVHQRDVPPLELTRALVRAGASLVIKVDWGQEETTNALDGVRVWKSSTSGIYIRRVHMLTILCMRLPRHKEIWWRLSHFL